MMLIFGVGVALEAKNRVLGLELYPGKSWLWSWSCLMFLSWHSKHLLTDYCKLLESLTGVSSMQFMSVKFEL